MNFGSRFDPRESRLLVVLAFLGGTLVHGVDQLLHFRAGPIPVLVTAPTVAVLTYLYMRSETRLGRLVALLGGGFVGTGLAVLGVYVVASSYRLPRPMTDPELVLYDFGLFLWFVLSLAGVYAVVARRTDQVRYGLTAVLFGPLLQFTWILLFVVLVEAGRYV